MMRMIQLNTLTLSQQDKFERETVINFNELEDEATMISLSPKEWDRMKKAGIKPSQKTNDCRWYKIPKDWIRVKKPGKPRGKPINEILQVWKPKISATIN